jgi:hypothetical protein
MILSEKFYEKKISISSAPISSFLYTIPRTYYGTELVLIKTKVPLQHLSYVQECSKELGDPRLFMKRQLTTFIHKLVLNTKYCISS